MCSCINSFICSIMPKPAIEPSQLYPVPLFLSATGTFSRLSHVVALLCVTVQHSARAAFAAQKSHEHSHERGHPFCILQVVLPLGTSSLHTTIFYYITLRILFRQRPPASYVPGYLTATLGLYCQFGIMWCPSCCLLHIHHQYNFSHMIPLSQHSKLRSLIG